MEALIYEREMEMSSDWHLFGGQLRDVCVQSTFADLQGHVLQNSWHGNSTGELLHRRPEADSLEDLTCHYFVDGIDTKRPSSLNILEGPSLYEDDLYDILSSSPEEAILPVDNDDTAMVNVASTVANSFNYVPSIGGGSGSAETKFDYEYPVSGQMYLISGIPENLSESRRVADDVLLDLIEVNKTMRTDSLAYEHDAALDSLHYESDYNPSGSELDGIECAYDSLLDSESVCTLLKQLVHSDLNSYRPVLLSVSPEEVESVLSSDSAPSVGEDYDSVLVPCSPPVYSSSFVPVSDVPLSSTEVLVTDYSQDSLSSPSSIRSQVSSPGVPYTLQARPDRKLKKKEQNKTAALRYRNKKREEKGVVYSEVEELEHKNAKLQERADDLTREINYLKGLLEEIRRQ